jgi:hypothetical protein
MAMFYKIAGVGEGDVTINWTSSVSTAILLMEWTGIAASPLDKTAKSDNAGAVHTKTSGTTDTTTVAKELVLANIQTGGVTTAQSWSNGFTDEYSPDAATIYVASLIVAATATYETAMTWTTDRVCGGLIATFKGN